MCVTFSSFLLVWSQLLYLYVIKRTIRLVILPPSVRNPASSVTSADRWDPKRFQLASPPLPQLAFAPSCVPSPPPRASSQTLTPTALGLLHSPAPPPLLSRRSHVPQTLTLSPLPPDAATATKSTTPGHSKHRSRRYRSLPRASVRGGDFQPPVVFLPPTLPPSATFLPAPPLPLPDPARHQRPTPDASPRLGQQNLANAAIPFSLAKLTRRLSSGGEDPEAAALYSLGGSNGSILGWKRSYTGFDWVLGCGMD